MLPPLTAVPEPKLPSLREVYWRWSKSKATRSTDSAAACGRALTLFEDFAGKLTLDRITRDNGDGFRAWLQEVERGTTPKTARDRFTWVKSLLKYALLPLGRARHRDTHDGKAKAVDGGGVGPPFRATATH